MEDLEEPSMVCEMCEIQEIRYVHYMEHPDYPDVLGVGCICAGYMEADYEGARRREQSLKSNGRRRTMARIPSTRSHRRGRDRWLLVAE